MNKRLKIVMIGPVYPYKGGISHYTGLMYNALTKRHYVKMVSYKMQYPKFLFKKEQKDYSNKTLEIPNTHYLIHTANPFNCIKSAWRIKKANPDVVVFQWWHPYFAPCYWIMEKILGKEVKKMFVCHNVFPHERFPFDRMLTKMVLKNGDYFVTHSQLDTDDLQSIKKDAKYFKSVLPTFNSFKMKNLNKEQARRLLNMSENEKSLLFFGFVREYKGLKHLINALPVIREQIQGIQLYIVGDFGDNKEDYIELIHKKGVEKNIKIFDGYIPDDEIEKFFVSTDLVVLPYESATQSGIVQIAYSFSKPVVVTDVGGLPEVVTNGKTGYVVKAQDDYELADAIVRFFKENKSKELESNVINENDKYSWERFVLGIESLIYNE